MNTERYSYIPITLYSTYIHTSAGNRRNVRDLKVIPGSGAKLMQKRSDFVKETLVVELLPPGKDFLGDYDTMGRPLLGDHRPVKGIYLCICITYIHIYICPCRYIYFDVYINAYKILI
jgi:hypothetical protein